MLKGLGCPIGMCRLFLCALFLSVVSVQAAQLRVLGGVKASVEQAPYLAALLQRNKLLQVQGLTVPVQAFVDSNSFSFEASLSNCGYGLEVCADAQGKVCLIARGSNTFADKVVNCSRAGGVAVLIYNYFPQVFLGVVGSEQPLPVYAVSSQSGIELLAHIDELVTFGYSENPADAGFFCGGSYVGEGWVLTAAHCVVDRSELDMLIAFGAGDYRDGRQLYRVDQVYSHLDFDSLGVSLGNDVALLSLAQIPTEVEAVQLSDWNDQRAAIAAGVTAQIYGRGEQGVVAAGGFAGASSMSARAHVADMPMVDQATCVTAMPNEPIESNMICAGSREGVGACFGDSGGPLIWQHNGQSKLLGVISWGVGCGLDGFYDVFASVATYREGLQALINGERLELYGQSKYSAPKSEEDEEQAADDLEGGGGAMGALWCLLLFRLRKTRDRCRC